MSYTFGGAATDDISVTSQVQFLTDNTVSFVAGWWYPTTLTATRAYWSAGDVAGSVVGGTTSEISMITDNATTDGVWDTASAGITVNKWWFIAWLAATENTTVPGAWRVWVGDEHNEPVQQTPTNTVTRVGNYTGSTNRTIGNLGTGSLAFQGDIGWVVTLVQNAVSSNSPLWVETSGAIATNEADLVRERWVLPIWRGKPDARFCINNGGSMTFSLLHIDMTQNPAVATQYSSGTSPNERPAITINGATFSENQPPIRFDPYWVHRRALPMRSTRRL